MKQRLVKGVRSVLPSQAVHLLENVYRKTRIQLVSARYGWPARGLRVIAVTGTNGKTTTANYINEILKQAGYKTAMFTTAVIEVAGESKINDLNATVASVSRMQQFLNEARRSKVDFVILEVTSHSLHQHKLDGVPIEAAVMTNLTQDHLDYHKTMEKYAAAKGLLFARNPRYIVLNRDDDWFDYFDRYLAEEQKITYGKSEDADVRISDIKLYKKGSEAVLAFDHQEKSQLATYLPGEYNVFNMAAAASICYVLGVSMSDIKNGIASLEGIPGRFERATKDEKYEVIVDYAHTPDALEKLLEATRNITKKRIILVFGACGDRDALKRPIMGKIAAKLADEIILTDEESYNEDPDKIRRDIYAGIEESKATNKTTEIADRREAIRHALNIAKKDDTILITGMGHEQFRIINGEKLPWNDTNIVREIISEKIKK
ncbi:UDP-N-acetylmuramoyl-L-alanyl-D-glutamate--2,6-diaminopimelate ligase [Candidatus Saccharibacteria bacterium]|jgi:UDP-N-acetylmuramoyl-L-alanyl-D-glutamate--2,6-diaminopimelate ligase|nr:UDP-N-acetylmuramoyl-L-alanyl-D-glutamate--2,6-diaminopimelate ligase [Candidatus Saccharibacteria bacterium]